MANCYHDEVDAGDMLADGDYSAGGGAGGDLFDMVWPGGRRREEDNTSGCLPLSPPPPPNVPELPSGDEIPTAAWLYPVLRDVELATDQLPDGGGGHVGLDDRPVAVAEDDSGERWTEDKVPTDEGICAMGTRSESNNERRKTSRARRSSRYSETHSLTERKRRCKINEKLKTLQQLVPGCSKSNQASTLDKTIRYMKSLQQHVKAMSVGCSMKPAAAAAVSYPFLQTPPYMRPAVAAGAGAPRPPPSMVPFSEPVLPLVHHPVPLMMMPVPLPLMIYPAPAGAPPSSGRL